MICCTSPSRSFRKALWPAPCKRRSPRASRISRPRATAAASRTKADTAPALLTAWAALYLEDVQQIYRTTTSPQGWTTANVTASYGLDGFTDEHRVALERWGVRRALIAYRRDESGDRAAEQLAAEALLPAGVVTTRMQCKPHAK